MEGKCLDCGKELGKYYKQNKSIRCKNCNYKKPKYIKHGMRCKSLNYFCTCGAKISNHSGKKLGTHQCKSCCKKGKNSPFYIDGKGKQKYPQKFSFKLKNQIRKRDKYKCQNPDCNMSQEEHCSLWHKILEVHHIDHNRINCKENNLITLCHKCNTLANFNIPYWILLYSKIIKRILK